MTVKLLATGVAAVATIGAAAAGVTSLASGAMHPHRRWRPSCSAHRSTRRRPRRASRRCRAPRSCPTSRPASPTQACRTRRKFGLVENGISADEGHVADHDLRKAFRNGNFPEQFAFTNIQPIGPNGASADVAITGPKFAGPVNKQLAFVDQGGTWVSAARRRARAGAGSHGRQLAVTARTSILATRSGSARTSIAAIRPPRTTKPMIAVARPSTKITAPAAPLTTAGRTSRSGAA